MRIAFFSTKLYDREFFAVENEAAVLRGTGQELHFLEPRLSTESVKLAAGFGGVCCFVNDQLNAEVLRALHAGGTRLIALRCAGFNQVELPVAAELGLRVVRVPAYSPYAVAEHAVGMMLTLNRKFHKAYNRVREGNFNLEGLLGFDMHGRTVGVVGTGKIGECAARILLGFGCRVLAYDVFPNETCRQLGIEYVSFDELLAQSSIITLHCPLLPATKHLFSHETFAKLQPGAMLINTSRGGLVDTRAAIAALKSGRLGYLGLDVYEEEADLFFRDLSERIIHDDLFTRLLTFNNVLITGHQAFFTRNALQQIAAVTLGNITAFERGDPLQNEVSAERVAK
jgi:D-lactate dehydrogenase